MKKVISLILVISMIACLFSVAAYAEEKDTSFDIGRGDYGAVNNPTKIQMTEVFGLGGKAEDDSSMAFILDEEGQSVSSLWLYPLTHLDELLIGTSGGKMGVYYSFNMYADGDPTVRITYKDSYELITWNADGTAKVGGVTDPVMLERGKWHKVTFSQNDSNGGRMACFIDGVRLATNSDSTWGTFTGKSRLGFGFTAGSKNGIVAFDDSTMEYWTSPDSYNASHRSKDLPVYGDVENITLETETNTIVYNDEAFDDTDSLAASISSAFTNSEYVGLFNADMSEPASSIPDAKIAVIKLDTDAYWYYYLKKEEFKPVSVTFNEDDSTIGATSVFTNTTSSDKSLVMILVLKDENGIIQKLVASPETVVTVGEENTEVIISPVESNGLNAEVFFIESWSTRLRLLDEIYINE